MFLCGIRNIHRADKPDSIYAATMPESRLFVPFVILTQVAVMVAAAVIFWYLQ